MSRATSGTPRRVRPVIVRLLISFTLGAVIIGTTVQVRMQHNSAEGDDAQNTTTAYDIDTSIAPVQAATADSFINSLGIGMHFMWPPIPSDQMKAALIDLNLHYVRDDLVVPYSTYLSQGSHWIDRIQDLKRNGISTLAVENYPNVPANEVMNYIHAANDSQPGTIYAIDGPDEIDNGCNPDPHVLSGVIWVPCDPTSVWLGPTENYMKSLHDTMAANQISKDMPIYSPSIGFANFGVQSTIKNYSTYANIHFYPIYTTPWYNDSIGNEMSGAAQFYGPTKPDVVTETGYPSVSLDQNRPSDEATQAKVLPLYYLENFKDGVLKTFIYQLVDAGGPDDYWGLLASDGRKKPAYYAVKTLTSTLNDPGASFSPGSLRFKVTNNAGGLTGSSAPISSLLLEKHDGTFYIELWQTKDTQAPAPLAGSEGAHVQNITVNFGNTVSSADLINVTDATGNSKVAQNQTFTNPSSIPNIKLGDGAIILKVTLANQPTPTPSASGNPTPTPSSKNGGGKFSPPPKGGGNQGNIHTTPTPTPEPSSESSSAPGTVPPPYSDTVFYTWWQKVEQHLGAAWRNLGRFF